MNKLATSTIYSEHSTFSKHNLEEDLSDIEVIVRGYKRRIFERLKFEETGTSPFELFGEKLKLPEKTGWVQENLNRFIKDTPNAELVKEYYLTAMGYVTCMVYSADGEHIVVGHSTGLIQMRHGFSGIVLATLRNIQYPPKPVYAIEFSRTEERVCYACCADGAIYRVEIPNMDSASSSHGSEMCIRIDPSLEWLNTVYYGSPGQSLYATPIISQRTPILSMSLSCDGKYLVAGTADYSVKIYDLNTLEAVHTFKVHKIRLQYIPQKMQRVHSHQVVAMRCHNDIPTMFASAAWDKTFRIWDTRCNVGCVATYNDVDVVGDAIDLNRQQAITGSWTTTEGLSLWDLTAKKRYSILRIQNRRPDVDGEYFYTCRYWRSAKYNRKGKYAIVGGSGTGCVEVINLHNRYITGSFPAAGNVIAVASFDDRIAFGGTAPVFNIVSFHDPKHEHYSPDEEPPYDYSQHPVTLVEAVYVPSSSPEPSVASGKEEDQASESSWNSDQGSEATTRTDTQYMQEIKQIAKDRKLSIPIDISKDPIKIRKIATMAQKVKAGSSKKTEDNEQN